MAGAKGESPEINVHDRSESVKPLDGSSEKGAKKSEFSEPSP
jgi:hypothetical protein